MGFKDCLQHSKSPMGGWMDAWMDGWVSGGGGKSSFEDWL